MVLALPREKEACPHNLAPTTSSLMTLAMGDVLAVALLESRNFTMDQYSVFHPGGQLGAKLVRIRDIMHSGDSIPLVTSGTMMTDAILQISQKGFGCVGVTGDNGKLIGIITDGDLARHLSPTLMSECVDDIMTKAPQTVGPDEVAMAALEVLNAKSISALLVTDADKPVGIVHFHDLLRLGAT